MILARDIRRRKKVEQSSCRVCGSFREKIMKKLVTLLLAAGMTASVCSPASAVDVKMDGRYQFQFQTGSEGFRGQNTDYAVQRLRIGMTFLAGENLSGYLQLQAGT